MLINVTSVILFLLDIRFVVVVVVAVVVVVVFMVVMVVVVLVVVVVGVVFVVVIVDAVKNELIFRLVSSASIRNPLNLILIQYICIDIDMGQKWL